MGSCLHETRMGQRFLEATAPRIADELARLNTILEALVEELRRRREPSSAGAAAQPGAPETR